MQGVAIPARENIARAMSHFPIPWQGNKRRELAKILPHIPAHCRTLVEPFAGTACVSFAHWSGAADRDACRYILGDQDAGLCAFITALRAEGLEPFLDWVRPRLNAADFMAIERGDPAADSPREWFYRRKVRRGVFDPKKEVPRKWPALSYSPSQRSGVEFFRSSRLEVVCQDWLATAEAHARDPYAVIYFDPPYFGAYNQWYDGREALTDEGGAVDGTTIFVEMARILRGGAATVIISTNGLAILLEVFGSFVREVYPVRYSNAFKHRSGKYGGKTSRHLIAVRIGLPPPTDEELDEFLAGL